MPPRLLVVEDDDIQQSVLRSALERRGYEVTVASDGLSAVREMRAGRFDLALIDYRLPEIDGLACARLLRDVTTDETRPKLIAVTASSDNLAERDLSGSAFDAIVPKPLELPALLSIVDTQLRGADGGEAMRAGEAAWRELGLALPPAAIVLPEPSMAQARLLRCCFDLSGRRPPEVVLLLGPEAADAAMEARCASLHFALPFVDLSGRCPDADAAFSATDRGSWRAVAGTLVRFAERRRLLPPRVLEATDLETRLLAYLFLSQRPLEPARDAAHPSCVRFPGFFPAEETRAAAGRLAASGLVERRFFDRFHACGSCGSFRLNVREECPGCRSAQLTEVQLVHHFRCAHQGPEEEFAQGPHLVCPKCRQHLRHYGSDYSKPGTVLCCEDCTRTIPEPAIGFTCTDCGGHTEGAAAATEDVFGYALTEEGAARLRRGGARMVPAAMPSDAALPPVIADALARGGNAAALFELRYGARERLLARRGRRAFEAMRRLFVETLVSAIEGDCIHAAAPEHDVILVRSAPSGVLDQLGPALLESCQDVLAEGLEPELWRLDLAAARAAAG